MNDAIGQLLATLAIFSALSIPLLTESCSKENAPVSNVAVTDFEDMETTTEYTAGETDTLEIEIVVEIADDNTLFVYDLNAGNNTVYTIEDSYDEQVVNATLVIEIDSFDEAFKAARNVLGAGREWIWYANNVVYTTDYAEEKAKRDSTQTAYWTEAELASGTSSPSSDSTVVEENK